jgi:hypothetical protein
MASLNGQTPADTYEGLLKTNDNGTLPSGADPAEPITDGAGNASNLKLHQDKVDFSQLEINGNTGNQGDYLKNNGSGSLVWSPLDISGKEDVANKNALNGYAGLDQFGQIANAQIPVNLGNHSINALTVFGTSDFKATVDFEKGVDFEDIVSFSKNVTFQGTGNRLFGGAGINEFLTETKFKNAVVRVEAGMNYTAGEVFFGNGNGVRFSAPLKDYYGAKPSGSGQALISLGTSGYVQWQDVGASTATGTYTVNSKVGTANYSPTSSSGAYAVTGDVVKCSGYIQPNATIYIQSFLSVVPPNTSTPPIRLTSLPFPAATIENNIGYEGGVNWLGGQFISAVRGGTLGSWVITDASGTQYGSGAIVGVIDENPNSIYDVAIYFAGATGTISIANNRFLKFDFEYIKS